MIVRLSLLVLCCLPLMAAAQIGVAGYYNLNSLPVDDRLGSEQPDLIGNGAEVALNYWFRLPNQRVEFLPTVYFSQADLFESGTFLVESGTFRQLGVQAKVNVYPFDFGGDCDCPTFGKQGPQLQKGFFVQVAPGYTLADLSYPTALNQPGFDDQRGFFTLAGAVGLDIGLSNFLTVTPTVGYRRAFDNLIDIEFTDVDGAPLETEETQLSTLQFGVHLGFRFDADRY